MADHRMLWRRPRAQAQAPAAAAHNYRPWYKENLPPKCFTKHNNKMKHPTLLDSRRWIFVRKGLDDFRKGCPPSQGLITGGFEGFLPQVHHKVPQPTPKKRQMTLLQEAALLSKVSPAQQTRKALMADIEDLQTLAFYQNLKEDLSEELLLKVLEVLNPDRKLMDTWTSCEDIRKSVKEPEKLLKKHSTGISLDPLNPKKASVSHPGQLFYKEKKSELDMLHKDDPVFYENVHREVNDFCNWVTSFGISNINEDFIMKQFQVDYLSQTNSDMLHIFNLNRIPLELKKSLGVNTLQKSELIQKSPYKQKLQNSQNPCKPKRIKMRYGAWYLNTKLWKKLRADEPLVDPKTTHKAQDNFKKKFQKEELFEELHGPAAFKDFILRKGYSMPSILEKVNIRKTYRKWTNTPIIRFSIEESQEDA